MALRFLIASLICVSAVAAADYWVEQSPAIVADAPPSTAQPPSIGAGQGATFENPLSHVAPQEFAVISERTLFSATRRAKAEPPPALDPVIAAPVAVVEATAPLPDPGDFTLLGVSDTNGQRIAMLRWNKTQEILRLKPGDDYTGWKIAEVNDRSVVVEQQGSSFSLKLFKGQVAPETTAAPD